MGYQDKPYEIVRRALQAIYQAPEDPGLYIDLFKCIADWEHFEIDQGPDEGQKIFNGLMSLYAFLENKGFAGEAEKLLVNIIVTFPEYYFPKLPRANPGDNVDYNLFREAREAARFKGVPEKPMMALTTFEEQFRKASLNLPLLAAEIASGSFYRDGPGRAGELFRSFADVVTLLQETSARDPLWELMFQLSVKLNNNVSSFNQAYLFLKALDTIKTSRPAGWVRDEIARSLSFFQRNYCWKNIDDGILAGDHKSILFWVDKALTLVKEPYERDYLLKIRSGSASKVEKPNHHSELLIALVILIVVSVIFILRNESDVKRKLNLEATRKEILQAVKTGVRPDEDKPVEENVVPVIPSSPPIRTRTGLMEYRPPLKPHGRKLTLPEVRHAVFQKERLDHLKKQSLSTAEMKLVADLEKDWKDRCEFYEYNNEDREKVYWDLQIHSVNLQLDAMDILAGWRSEPDFTGKILNSGTLLDFNNALHFQIVVNRLKELGLLKPADAPKYWNQECSRALMEFKATHLSVQNSIWDRKTQDAMFPGLR